MHCQVIIYQINRLQLNYLSQSISWPSASLLLLLGQAPSSVSGWFHIQPLGLWLHCHLLLWLHRHLPLLLNKLLDKLGPVYCSLKLELLLQAVHPAPAKFLTKAGLDILQQRLTSTTMLGFRSEAVLNSVLLEALGNMDRQEFHSCSCNRFLGCHNS